MDMDATWTNGTPEAAPEVVLLQPVALVDHLCTVDETTADKLADGALGGSSRCNAEQLQKLLLQVGEFTCRAGGSASNVARGLASGFGVAAAVVGACGCDEWGSLWHASMKRSGVSTKHVLNLPGSTGRSVVLLAAGERSCRTCLDPAVSFPGSSLQQQHLQGASWLFVSGYAAYQDDLLPAAVSLARELGVRVALDLASWELLQSHWDLVRDTLPTGGVDLCFCNEEEAKQLCRLGALQQNTPEAALQYLLHHCNTDVVTLGAEGCIAGTKDSRIAGNRRFSRTDTGALKRLAQPALPQPAAGLSSVDNANGNSSCYSASKNTAGQQQQQQVAQPTGVTVVRQPGVAGVQVVDVTGAGDMFAAGFLHGMLRGWSLQRCAEAACLSGAAAVQVLGADVGRAQLHWMHKRLLGPHAAAALAEVAGQVAREQLAAYGLVEKLGRGVVYFGSARVQSSSSIWQQTQQLAQQVSLLLGSTTWTGGGPGLMQAASEGAAAAGGAVGGIRLQREAGTTVLSGGYLPEDVQVVCRYLCTRKAGLIQAGCPASSEHRTAFIFLPGGLGTVDELFELLTLVQLKKLPHTNSNGSAAATTAEQLSTPIILLDYDGFYQGFIKLIQGCEQHGMLRSEELQHVTVAASNSAALQQLAQHYKLSVHPELQLDGIAAPSTVLAGN